MAAQIVFSTTGAASAFTSTTNSTPVFLSATRSVTFTSTAGQAPLFLTSQRAVAFTTTLSPTPVFLSASQSVTFLVTPNTSTTKLLVLKIGEISFDSGQTYVEIPDATGEYNPADPNENPGGWKPNGDPFIDGRPARDEAYLWTVYRIWSRSTVDGYGENTQTPASQDDETEDPYIYTLTFPTETVGTETTPIRGIYELIMMAVPLTETYVLGDVQLAQKAAQLPDWYVTSVGVMVDPDVVNCLNRKRYEFLQEIMCGRCDEGYLHFYGMYVGMINAMEVQDWDRATEFYDKLKEICAQEVSSCGC
jgi:hypothetical protein